jgi:hypothetical protein
MTETKKKASKKQRRRPDASTMAEIKKVQDAKREEVLAKAPPKPATQSSEAISYDQWWMIVNRKIKLQPWLKEVMFADFKARGAGKMETEKRYNELLKLFGYQI